MKYPLVSIIISNYNGAKLGILQECLRSFVKNDYPNFEILLIDNASTDGSVNEVRKIFGKDKRFRIIQNDVNLYSKGVNLGFREARGDFIALFNNDVITGKGYIKILVNAFRDYPKLAVVQGKFIWQKDKYIIDSAGETMDIYGNPVTIGYQTVDDGRYDKVEEILSASGAACLIKKSALDDVGIYDDNFGIGYEDMDLSLRLRHKKYLLLRIPNAVCYHMRGMTDLSPMVRINVRWHFNKNRISTMIRNYPAHLLFKALPVTFLIYFGSMLWEVFILKNIPLAMTRPRSVWWVFWHIGTLVRQRKIIRSSASISSDRKIIKLMAKSDIMGKVVAVFLDRFKKGTS